MGIFLSSTILSSLRDFFIIFVKNPLMMKKSIFIISVMALIASCKPGDKSPVQYIETARIDVVDTIFGTPVTDPYRWLEDDKSAETMEWVKQQNVVTFAYLNEIPYREEIKNRLTAMWNYEKFSAPFKEGEYTYFAKNDGLQNQFVIYRQKDGGEAEVFLDPNTFSADGTTSLDQIDRKSVV